MERIVYGNRHVPSCSWMPYYGAIQFIDIPLGNVLWNATLRFNEGYEHALITDVWQFCDYTIKPDGAGHTILNFGGATAEWAQYVLLPG